jgi:hypothetical protein
VKFRLTLLLLVCFAALSTSPTALARGKCIAQHGASFCKVKEDRTAIKILRKQIRVQAKRTNFHMELKPLRRLTWNVAKIDRANRWHRHLYRVLRTKPTFWPSPQNYAAWLGEQKYGWRQNEFNCLDTLWGDRESGWDMHNVNSSSGASGIPQRLGNGSLPWNWYTDFRVQVRWGIDYIKARYGTACAALAHSYANNWY